MVSHQNIHPLCCLFPGTGRKPWYLVSGKHSHLLVGAEFLLFSFKQGVHNERAVSLAGDVVRRETELLHLFHLHFRRGFKLPRKSGRVVIGKPHLFNGTVAFNGTKYHLVKLVVDDGKVLVHLDQLPVF